MLVSGTLKIIRYYCRLPHIHRPDKHNVFTRTNHVKVRGFAIGYRLILAKN
jgi:hypothetical protein